jgi:hypothetical protein
MASTPFNQFQRIQNQTGNEPNQYENFKEIHALRNLQYPPPIELNPQDFRRELVLGSQPVDAVPPRADQNVGTSGVLDDRITLATSEVHVPLRTTMAGVSLPDPGVNYKVWSKFISGIGRTCMVNENDLFIKPGHSAFTGDIMIRNKELINIPLKEEYTDEELRQLFGKPEIFAEGTAAWYAYQWSAVNPDQEMYFAYDKQMQTWKPTFYNGNRVFPKEWNADMLNKPQPAVYPTKQSTPLVGERIRSLVPPMPDAPQFVSGY